ncbi:antitoxin [candidate division NPL-UPA2 bacterium]|nr:antitoxin [candidate division NPL-UPA2 bacterium]
MKLDKKEKELLESYERGEWKTIPNPKKEAGRYCKYAKATFRKDKRVNIRIAEKDLMDIRKKAAEEGLPYQTLISSVLHKFVNGRLAEKTP